MTNTLTTKVNQDPRLALIELLADEVRPAEQRTPVTCLANLAKAVGVTVAGGAAGYALGHAIN